jgi:hypothetical protein
MPVGVPRPLLVVILAFATISCAPSSTDRGSQPVPPDGSSESGWQCLVGYRLDPPDRQAQAQPSCVSPDGRYDQTAFFMGSRPEPTAGPARTATPVPTTFIQSNRVPAVGRQGRVRIEVPFTFGATSEANFAAMVKASQVGDKLGIAEMALQRRIYDVDNGTSVLVIDRRNELSQVRILDGIDQGRALWLFTRFLDY